jgi:dynein heavy chain
MYSKEKEVVELTKPVKTRNPVETWLNLLAEEMKTTVYRKLKEGQKAYTDDTRKDWVLLHPGQIVATIAQI